MTHSEARERVLEAAERLFGERGYTAVTIKDIAIAAGIHHASLYHHAPGGKEQLFVEVTERTLRRHHDGLAEAIRNGNNDFRQQLQGVARWLLSQAPMDLIRMTHSDSQAISQANADALFQRAFEAMLIPLYEVFQQAQDRGDIAPHPNLGNIAGALFAAIESLHSLPRQYLAVPLPTMADEIIDVFIAGLNHL